MLIIKYFIIAALVIVSLCNSAMAQEAETQDSITSNRIKGVAEFLTDRANDNFMYILQLNMRKNKLLQCYFPETYKYAASNNLQLLLQSSNSKLWKVSVENDMKNFGVNLIAREMHPEQLDHWAEEIQREYMKALLSINVRFDQKDYSIMQLVSKDSQELPILPKDLQSALSKLYDDYLDANEKFIDNILYKVKKARTQNSDNDSELLLDSCPTEPYGEISSILWSVANEIDDFKKKFESNYHNRLEITSKTEPALTPGEAFYDYLITPIYKFIDGSSLDLVELSTQVRAISKENNLVVAMFKLDYLIRTTISDKDNPLRSINNIREYNQFSKYAMSFAVLSEARDSNQVKQVMEQLTLPSISFGAKREPGANRIMLTSLFNLVYGRETIIDQVKANKFWGLSVPIGLEFSHGLTHDGLLQGSVSVMISPFDLAYPVNQIINNSSDAISLRDIVIPGVYVSYGFKELPMVVGLGLSRGPSVTEVQVGNKQKIFVFVGMDMPLFSLH